METALVIRMSQAEQEMAETVNVIMQRHDLPCFLLESIIYKIYRQVADGKAAELSAAKNRSVVKEEVYANN